MMRRVISPVRASARYRSIENRSFSEKKMSWLPSGLSAAHEQPPVRVGDLRLLRERPVVGLDRSVPAQDERVGPNPRDREQRAFRVARPPRPPQDVSDRGVAEAAGDIRPERLAVSVREVSRVVELADRGQRVALRRVPEPHRGVRVDGPEGEVLRHPLDEPQRQARGARHAEAARSLPRDVKLKRVHQLVADHVVRFGERARERQHDPPLHSLGDAARALAERSRNRVRLLEVGVTGVEDQRLAASQLMVEDLREPRVPPLGEPAGLRGRLALSRVVVDVEVRRLEKLEGKARVLDLVAPEVLGVDGRRHAKERGGQHLDGGDASRTLRHGSSPFRVVNPDARRMKPP